LKYKNIKSVAHNLGHSFLSDMNAVDVRGQYTIVPELLFADAARAAVPEVKLDFLARTIEPPLLASPALEASLANYARMLFELCAHQNVDAHAIHSATLSIAFDYSRSRRTPYEPTVAIQEFVCTVSIEDDRRVVHMAKPDHWWKV
jgi:hypothetical protein